jgi:NTP pyrophosphatase (non-canonical NTP hydrolase)
MAKKPASMGFSEYQRLAMSTAIYPREYSIYYPALGLSGEVGELNNKIKKRIRDHAELDREDMKSELGDVLWYVSALASDLGLDLGDVAASNVDKLLRRRKNGTIKGSGDMR